MRKLTLSSVTFDEEAHGKSLGRMLSDSKSMRELDIQNCDFQHPKSFFDCCQALLTEKCRLNVLKLRGLTLTNLESKVIQFILMKNKLLHTIDFSHCRVDNAENLEYFIQKFDQFSNVRYLTLDGIGPDVSSSAEILGEALALNTKMEVLQLREARIKWFSYQKFWDNLKGNKTIRKISVSKTDMTDRVLESAVNYFCAETSQIVDLDLSRNLISDTGLTAFSQALKHNKTIKYLNLGSNHIKEKGLEDLSEWLNEPECPIQELALSGNKINNEGIKILSETLGTNKSLKMLDLSKNEFNDHGFNSFALEVCNNHTLLFLDISRNKDLSDEGSLVSLAQSIAFNKSIQTLDLNGIRIRKPFLKGHFEPALKSNITLKFVMGKLTPDIIDEEL